MKYLSALFIVGLFIIALPSEGHCKKKTSKEETPLSEKSPMATDKIMSLQLTSGCKAQPTDPVQHLRDLYSSQKFEETAEMAQTSLASITNSSCYAEALFITAMACAENQEYAKAIGYWQQLIETVPDTPLRPLAYLRIGGMQFAASRYDAALQAYTALRNSYPGSREAGEAQFKITQCLSAAKRIPEAVRATLDYAKDHPGDERIITVCKNLLRESLSSTEKISQTDTTELAKCSQRIPFEPGFTVH